MTDRIALKQRIMRKVEALLDELMESPNAPKTIDEIEDAALKLRQRAGEIVAQELADAAREEAVPVGDAPDAAAPQSHTVECPCGRKARYKGEATRSVVTMVGGVTLSRPYYYCRRCDAGLCPVDRLLGLPEGAYTPRVQREVARVSALMPFTGAARLLYDLSGVSVSAKEAQHLATRIGERVLEQRERERQAAMAGEEPPGRTRTPDVLYLEADGVMTPMTDGYKETKVGLARGLRDDGEEAFTNQYTATLENAEAFGEHWYALALRSGLQTAKQVVVLGDGAAWIWNQAGYHFPEAEQILDVFHATEHLYEAARSAYGESAEETLLFGNARKAELHEGRINAILSALHDLAQQEPHAKEVVRQTIGYIENNRRRMDYPRYRQMGLSIGSGAAESGCKQVITQRLKGAGMRWKELGAQAISALRCLILSDQWPQHGRPLFATS